MGGHESPKTQYLEGLPQIKLGCWIHFQLTDSLRMCPGSGGIIPMSNPVSYGQTHCIYKSFLIKNLSTIKII